MRNIIIALKIGEVTEDFLNQSFFGGKVFYDECDLEIAKERGGEPHGITGEEVSRLLIEEGMLHGPHTKEEIVEAIRDYCFPGKPLHSDYLKNGSPIIDFDRYFEAEKKAAEKYMESYFESNRDCTFYSVFFNFLHDLGDQMLECIPEEFIFTIPPKEYSFSEY